MAPVAVPLPQLPASSPFNSPEYEVIEQRLKAYRDQPRPTKWEEQGRWEMAIVHSFLISGLLRVYAYAEYAVEHDDLANYLGFADCALAQIHEHHHFEEEFYFPFVEKAINDGDARLTKNVNEHHLFEKQLTATWLYIRDCRSGLTPTPKPITTPTPSDEDRKVNPAEYGLDPSQGFNPSALRASLDGWLIPLLTHLNGELDTLEPEWLVKMGKKKHEECGKAVLKHLQEYDPSWFLVFGIASLPNSAASQLIALPLPVRKLLVPLVWARTYSGFWRYCSHPENLAFW